MRHLPLRRLTSLGLTFALLAIPTIVTVLAAAPRGRAVHANNLSTHRLAGSCYPRGLRAPKEPA